jgi:hypothetical protein
MRHCSFYPIFPPPPNSGAPLDLQFMKQFQFEQTPDILLLPSILNRFCGVCVRLLLPVMLDLGH